MYNVNDMKNTLKEIIKVLLTAAILAFLLMKFVLIPCVVDGASMNPILVNNDFGYSFVLSRNLGIRRFDIAVISIKNDSGQKLLVKRVVGLPGERVEYRENKLYIDGEYVTEPFLSELIVTDDLDIVLGDEEYFCLGDNRSISRDSRYYGPFEKKDIISTHLFVLFPFDHFGIKD